MSSKKPKAPKMYGKKHPKPKAPTMPGDDGRRAPTRHEREATRAEARKDAVGIEPRKIAHQSRLAHIERRLTALDGEGAREASWDDVPPRPTEGAHGHDADPAG